MCHTVNHIRTHLLMRLIWSRKQALQAECLWVGYSSPMYAYNIESVFSLTDTRS